VANLRRGERGQIILVAAFALAVIFVAMALIVNSAIFTENLASRGETTGSNGALSMRAMVETNVGDGVAAANRNNYSSESDLTAAVRASIRTISEQTGRQSARSGRLVDISYQDERFGERIYQSDSNFTNGDNDENYQVVGSVGRVTDGNGTRAFRIDATSISASDNDSAFTVRVQDSDITTGNENSWRARIWRVDSTTIHVRTIKNDDGTASTEDCEIIHDASLPSVRIDVTGGTIDGEECDALATAPSGENFHFGAGATDTYDISFENAANIEGNFSMVVHPESTLDLAGLLSGPESDPALYDVTVRYSYLTTDLRYETDVRVAPGEPDA
jgi:hypothetical protein